MDKELLSRRDFLRRVGAAGAFMAATPWLSAFSSLDETAHEKCRIGMIGPGSRGCLHLTFLKDLPNAEVTALADIYRPSLDNGLAIWPKAKAYTDYRRLLEDKNVDAVMICTPLDTHYRMTLDAFAAGKHVFCEKALGYDCDQTLEMYNAYKRSGKVFIIGQQRMFDPSYIKAMEYVRHGTIGKVSAINCYWYRNADWRRPVPSPELERQINWRLYKEHSKGLMTELACHQLQLGTWVWGEVPAKIMGTGAITCWKDGREVDDNVHLIYKYAGGEQMTYASVISNKFYGMEEQVLGKLGTLELEKGKLFFEDVDPAPAFLRLINEWENKVFDSTGLAGTSWVPETADKIGGEFITGKKRGTDGTSELDAAFVEAAITGKQPGGIAEEGYYSSILSLLGYDAIEKGEVLDFPEKYRIDYL